VKILSIFVAISENVNFTRGRGIESSFRKNLLAELLSSFSHRFL
jgi:hypothetical protein